MLQCVMSAIDLTNQKFARLLVVCRSEKKSKVGAIWRCLCDCGKYADAPTLKLRNGLIKSCGCWRHEMAGVTSTTHGLSNKSRTYRTWKEMRQRCMNPNSDKWKWYGGRGISIDPAWDDFTVFLADMGDRPEGMTLDRIDNNESYCKENCRWASHIDQTQKQKKNKLSVHLAQCLRADRAAGMQYRDLGKKYGISATTAHRCAVGITWPNAPLP
jgi:hypothetical protein